MIHPFIHLTNIYWAPVIAPGAQGISTEQTHPHNHHAAREPLLADARGRLGLRPVGAYRFAERYVQSYGLRGVQR